MTIKHNYELMCAIELKGNPGFTLTEAGEGHIRFRGGFRAFETADCHCNLSLLRYSDCLESSQLALRGPCWFGGPEQLPSCLMVRDTSDHSEPAHQKHQ